MHPSAYPTAWDHPPTRRAWAKQMMRNIIASLCWFLTPWAALVMFDVFLSSAFAALIVIPFVYGLYRTLIAIAFVIVFVRVRRILRTYPWRLDRAPYSLSQHPESPHRHPWIELPNPEPPGEPIPLYFLTHYRVGWWHRRMLPRAKPGLKAQLDPIWFAGDPRFFGVIAVTRRRSGAAGLEPRRLHLLRQSRAHNPWQASANDVARARQAGGKGWGTP